jgi:hypothetical protein
MARRTAVLLITLTVVAASASAAAAQMPNFRDYAGGRAPSSSDGSGSTPNGQVDSGAIMTAAKRVQSAIDRMADGARVEETELDNAYVSLNQLTTRWHASPCMAQFHAAESDAKGVRGAPAGMPVQETRRLAHAKAERAVQCYADLLRKYPGGVRSAGKSAAPADRGSADERPRNTAAAAAAPRAGDSGRSADKGRSAASGSGPCALVTESEASQALGQAVRVLSAPAGSHAKGEDCLYETSGPGPKKSLHIDTTNLTNSWLSKFNEATPVSGVGDKAYYMFPMIEVHKGSKFVQISLGPNRRDRYPDAYSVLVNLGKLAAGRL